MNTLSLITESYDGQIIPFQASDAFVNATAMCAAFGKRPNDFLRLPSTQAFISVLSEETGVMRENLVSLFRGNFSDGTKQGTWLHPDLALECARWLSPRFAIWCNKVILRILFGKADVRPAFIVPKTMPEALRLAADSMERAAAAESEVKKLTPKAEFYDAVVSSPDLIHLNEASKLIGIGRNTFMARLREKGVLCRNNTPQQVWLDKGYFELSLTKWTHPDGTVHVHPTTMVTQRGLDFLRRCVARLTQLNAREALEAQTRFPTIAAPQPAPTPRPSLVKQYIEATQAPKTLN